MVGSTRVFPQSKNIKSFKINDWKRTESYTGIYGALTSNTHIVLHDTV